MRPELRAQQALQPAPADGLATPVRQGLRRRILLAAGALLAAGLLVLAGLVASAWAPDRPVDTLKARWAQPPSQFITVMGMEVHVRDEGPRSDPQPIVLIHGTSASLHTWDGWTEALKPHRRVIRFDLPGFGLTGPHPQGLYDNAANVAFVLALLDRMGVAECVLGGNSLGGEVAWRTAVAAPHRVSRLVLVAAAGYPMTARAVPVAFRLAATPALHGVMRHLLPRQVVSASVRSVYANPDRVSTELVDRYYELALREGNRQALAQRVAQVRWGEDIHRIRGLQQPTLLIWGAQDRLIPPEHAARFRREIIGSTLRVFNHLGHVPQEEDPEATVAVVKAFLKI